MVKLIIPGKPMGKQRPRLGKGFTYTPTATVNYETLVKELFILSKQNKLEGNLRAIIVAYFPIPQSKSKKQKQEMREALIRPRKPDCDNIAKIILDALNNLAYDDDSQVVELSVTKYYDDEPRVEVWIETLRG